MIVLAATFSLSKASECLNRWPERHPFAAHKRAWIGFETGDGDDASPLRKVFDGPSELIRMGDIDYDAEWRRHREQYGQPHPLAPSPRLAHKIVRFVLDLHRAPETYALAVHCHAGLYRSGAVVEWVRADLGVEEHECSNRVVVCGNVEPTRNEMLLRLLREAHAERRLTALA